MLFIQEKTIEEYNKIINFIADVNNEFNAVTTVDADEVIEESTTQKYLNSLVTSQYEHSVQAINREVSTNRSRKKRNLQQIMKESFFYGANRYGNNFIA